MHDAAVIIVSTLGSCDGPASTRIPLNERRPHRTGSFNVLNYFTTLNARGAKTVQQRQDQLRKITEGALALRADVIAIVEVCPSALLLAGNNSVAITMSASLASVTDGPVAVVALFDRGPADAHGLDVLALFDSMANPAVGVGATELGVTARLIRYTTAPQGVLWSRGCC